MRKHEVRIDFDAIQDPEAITDQNKRLFQRHGLDMQRHECDLEDDPDRKQRVLKLKPATKYFYTK